MPSVTYKWVQAKGELKLGENVLATGYAGAPGHKNKTESEQLKNLGPIPRGGYEITLIYPKHEKFGQYCCVLKPDLKNKMFGRSAFMIHADSIAKPGEASEGCIVLGPKYRAIFRVGDRVEVV